MTDIIAKAEDAMAGVTEGPWYIFSGAGAFIGRESQRGWRTVVVDIDEAKIVPEDARFIAAARQLVPNLIAHARAQADEIERIKAALLDAAQALEWCARECRMPSPAHRLIVKKWADENRAALTMEAKP
jgi:hypothetical protein